MPLFNKDQTKNWVGTCPPCPPRSDAPDTYKVQRLEFAEQSFLENFNAYHYKVTYV